MNLLRTVVLTARAYYVAIRVKSPLSGCNTNTFRSYGEVFELKPYQTPLKSYFSGSKPGCNLTRDFHKQRIHLWPITGSSDDLMSIRSSCALAPHEQEIINFRGCILVFLVVLESIVYWGHSDKYILIAAHGIPFHFYWTPCMTKFIDIDVVNNIKKVLHYSAWQELPSLFIN